MFILVVVGLNLTQKVAIDCFFLKIHEEGHIPVTVVSILPKLY